MKTTCPTPLPTPADQARWPLSVALLAALLLLALTGWLLPPALREVQANLRAATATGLAADPLATLAR